MYKAILFDMDGTIFDTQNLYDKCLYDAGCNLNIKFDKSIIEMLRGYTTTDAYDVCTDHLEGNRERAVEWVDHSVELFINELKLKGPDVKDGIHDLFDYLLVLDIPKALVSSSEAEIIEINLCKSGLPDIFSVTISGEDIEHGNPEPDPYLLAAERLGIDPSECIVVEDSASGAISALAAKCTVILIPDYITPDESILTQCEAVVDTAHDAIPVIKRLLCES